ncbi:MAG: hypothetical protein GY750_12150 [Lentisphaerae bacterium]|nr:hypothetical protein [Lentisphaerota bacterium]MCP4102165.1 hypothetical protein [Lentisphaerota bacterium]
MNLDTLILENDQLVKQTVRKYQRLQTFVHFYLNGRFEDLYGEHRNNVVSVMASYLLPRLLAYNNYIRREHNFRAYAEPRRGRFSGIFSFNQEGIKEWLSQLFSDISQVIPEIRPIPPGSRPDIRPQMQLKEAIGNRLTRCRQRRNSPSLYFWETVNCYYKNQPPHLENAMPNPQNLMQLIPYSREEALRLETLVKSKLERFCIRNRVINAMHQEPPVPNQFTRCQPAPVRTTSVSAQALDDSEEVDAPEDLGYSATDFAEEFNFSAEAKKIIAQDLFVYSMALESWENMTYISADTKELESLPYPVTVSRFITEAYQQLFNTIHAGNTQEGTINIVLGISFNFYVSNVHIFTKGIYSAENQMTESATIILEGLRRLRQRNRAGLITPRGSNIWQRSICEQFCRSGKTFY